jgi:hypothetical protein
MQQGPQQPPNVTVCSNATCWNRADWVASTCTNITINGQAVLGIKNANFCDFHQKEFTETINKMAQYRLNNQFGRQ